MTVSAKFDHWLKGCILALSSAPGIEGPSPFARFGHRAQGRMVIAIDIDRVGKTMRAWSPSTDSQLRTVRAAADRVPAEKRGVFIDRVVARLQRQRGFIDADLDDAVRAALTWLIKSAA